MLWLPSLGHQWLRGSPLSTGLPGGERGDARREGQGVESDSGQMDPTQCLQLVCCHVSQGVPFSRVWGTVGPGRGGGRREL